MSYFRILLVPVFIIVYLNAKDLSGYIWSIVVVVISAGTDVLDGIVARKLNQVTDLGKILDPIADKAMQFAILFCEVIRYPWVILLIVIFALKEIISLIFSGYLFAHNKNIGGAIWCGKLCTVVLYCVMLTFIALPNLPKKVEITLVLIAGAFMLLAFTVYMSAYIKLLVELRREQRAAKKTSAEDSHP